jgi:opacity protein-like surface antigen
MANRDSFLAAAWLAAVALGVPAVAAAENWFYGAEAFAGYDSNAGNSGTGHDRQGSAFLYGATSSTREQRFGSRTALQLRESIALERWLQLEQLTNMRYAVRMRVLHRPGRSFRSPLLAADVGAAARHSASAIRSGFDFRTGLSAMVPLTHRVVARSGVARLWREASHGRTFDLGSTSYTLDLDWRLDDGWTAYAGVRVDDGDFTVTGRGFGIVEPKDQHLYLEPRASAIEADPAFGQDWWAFRVDGTTTTVTLGMNVPLSPAMSLDVQVLRGEANMNRFTYERWVGSVGLVFRW